MAVESATDRATFLADFGEAATYRLARNGGDSAVTGIFGEAAATAFGQPGVSTTRPEFLMRADDLPATARGGEDADRLTVAGRLFSVMEILRDGTGMARLVLEERQA